MKSLKLTKQITAGPKNAKVAKLTATPAGQKALHESEAVGGIRLAVVRELVKQSNDLTDLLRELDQHGPLVLPILVPLPGAPRKGAPYKAVIPHGIAQFWELPAFRAGSHVLTTKSTATPAQMLKDATALALKMNPVAHINNSEKIIPVAQVTRITLA